MAKVKDGQEALITREQYNTLKRMDRPDAEAFLRTIYEKGYTKGCKDTEAKHKEEQDRAAAASTAGQHTKFKDELITLLNTISGIGPATLRKIKEALEKWSV